ncbi:MAG: hypothetical protein KJ060_10570 [Candidatus Hydrogenedentes bacterium]|nr:hypothetical protein [Candidatus Hydrogenedentota bacterium]
MAATRRIAAFLLLLLICLSGDAGAPLPGDPDLLALVDTEFTSVEDFLIRVSDLETALASKGDNRAVFAGMYRVLTENGLESIQNGTYDDPDWVTRFVVAFANLYREAFYHFETGQYDEVPEVWRIVFEAAQADEITAFQHGLLGVHAHINRDLPFALARATPRGERAARFPDFQRTNIMVVNSTEDVESVVSETYAPALTGFDMRFRNVDEAILGQLVSTWRQRAWRNARLFDGSEPEWVEQFAMAYLDRITARQALRMATDFGKSSKRERNYAWGWDSR